jgi:hypothetical protein
MYAYTGTEFYMTLPDERYRSIHQAEQFLQDLCDPNKTPRVPRVVRARASAVLRHYPSQWHLDQLAAAAPEVVVKQMEPLHKMIVSWDLGQQAESDVDKSSS